MDVLVKYEEDFGRMGELDALLIMPEQQFKDMSGSTVYLGERLGKHSDVEADLCPENFKVICDDQDFIDKLRKYVTNPDYPNHISGVDLLCHWEEQHDSDHDSRR